MDFKLENLQGCNSVLRKSVPYMSLISSKIILSRNYQLYVCDTVINYYFLSYITIYENIANIPLIFFRSN